MRVTKDDIVKIKAGTTKHFIVDDGKACNAARVMVQYVKRTCLPEDVAGYKTDIDWDQHIVSITALAGENK